MYSDFDSKDTACGKRPASHEKRATSGVTFYSLDDTGADAVVPKAQRYRAPRAAFMRVIAGKFRSRPLQSLRGMDIRPTSDRLRETLFNVLSAGYPGAVDVTVWLFQLARTGSVGIEALSRGAAHVTFVESARDAAAVIEKNLRSLGIAEGFHILRMEVRAALRKVGEREDAVHIV